MTTEILLELGRIVLVVVFLWLLFRTLYGADRGRQLGEGGPHHD